VASESQAASLRGMWCCGVPDICEAARAGYHGVLWAAICTCVVVCSMVSCHLLQRTPCLHDNAPGMPLSSAFVSLLTRVP
jgi:hypothetical protein